jgi:hypothetical protein
MNGSSAKQVSSESSATDELNRLIAENLPAQDELEFELGDTLDIKMSIVLVVIVFLADQSRKFLESPMPLHWENFQRVSVFALIVAGGLSLWELFPREYKTRMGQDEFLGWVEQLKAFYDHEGVANPDAKIVELIRIKDAERTSERIAANKSINARKSRAMEWSFYSVMIAVALNLITLSALSTGWRF